jgi:hypothetical protein
VCLIVCLRAAGTYLHELTAREDAVLRELHQLYNRSTALRGFYHPAELYSTSCFSSVHQCNSTHLSALASMVEPSAKV